MDTPPPSRRSPRSVVQREAGPYFLLEGEGGSSEAPGLNSGGDGDSSRLGQLGYKQELGLRLSAISNFAVTFTAVSVLTGITTTFGTGLEFGGPLTMVYGPSRPVVGLFTLLVGSSMAEICSSYPTSGGLYYWSAKLCGNEWSSFASWITRW
ncbi:unnamed protein product [Spirodela intermedia]|uniref:Uncharacterized protein n=1 Tax=Spirodela intermedia TaxID=51605 RepID=A0A7I8LL56_SPIIN|nr:unnamed protein product [Spirodela intermedia]